MLLVSLGSTRGLRAADEQLCAALQRAGATTRLVQRDSACAVRTMMLTDLAWARAPRRASEALAADAASPPRAIVYSSTTAALLWPARGSDPLRRARCGQPAGRARAVAAPAGAPRLRAAPLLLPWSDGGLREASLPSSEQSRALVLPVAVALIGPRAGARTSLRSPTQANPSKKGLDRVLAAWRVLRASSAQRAGRELLDRGGRGARSCRCGDQRGAGGGCARARHARARALPRGCCAARGCSCARHGARTTGSRSSRRSPTGACW